jgi:hypothetical protein
MYTSAPIWERHKITQNICETIAEDFDDQPFEDGKLELPLAPQFSSRYKDNRAAKYQATTKREKWV